MVGFGQFCPVAVACEVFAERWTPIIMRELLAGSTRFNQLQQGIPRISRALLARRLRSLEAAGVITSVPLPDRRGNEYRLTAAGEDFRGVIEGLGQWGQRWTVRVDPAHLDAGVLMWSMRRRITVDQLPASRLVVHFEFTRVPSAHRGPRMFWLLLERPEPDLCLSDPGFDIGLYVQADLAAMTRVWLGDLPLGSALRSQEVRLTGSHAQIRAFPTWLPLSPFAGVSRPLTAAE